MAAICKAAAGPLGLRQAVLAEGEAWASCCPTIPARSHALMHPWTRAAGTRTLTSPLLGRRRQGATACSWRRSQASPNPKPCLYRAQLSATPDAWRPLCMQRAVLHRRCSPLPQPRRVELGRGAVTALRASSAPARSHGSYHPLICVPACIQKRPLHLSRLPAGRGAGIQRPARAGSHIRGAGNAGRRQARRRRQRALRHRNIQNLPPCAVRAGALLQ